MKPFEDPDGAHSHDGISQSRVGRIRDTRIHIAAQHGGDAYMHESDLRNVPREGQRQLLISALQANGLSTDWSDWRDSQGLGAAVRDVLRSGETARAHDEEDELRQRAREPR